MVRTINDSEFLGAIPGYCVREGMKVLCKSRFGCPVKKCYFRDKYRKNETRENPFSEGVVL